MWLRQLRLHTLVFFLNLLATYTAVFLFSLAADSIGEQFAQCALSFVVCLQIYGLTAMFLSRRGLLHWSAWLCCMVSVAVLYFLHVGA
ncbi:hypothetical protein ACWKWU_04620 [Chitinophaga lutea]